jgi:hypothetical protein
MTIEIILKLLGYLSKDTKRELYSKLGEMVKNDRARYILTDEQKKAIKDRTAELVKNSNGEIPAYIFGHKSFHEEYNSSPWHE